jgi:membrane protease YdiL (CAAX protease family)
MIAVCAVASLAMGAPVSDLERARQLCEQGQYLEAIDLFDRLLAAHAGTEQAAEADDALDRCVGKLASTEHSSALLREISDKYAGRAAGAKALGALAREHLPEEGDCRAPSPYYEELLNRYGRTREAARVISLRAIHCLQERKHERQAIRDLEEVADAQAGKPEGAFALWRIGSHYRDTEQRDRAATYYQRLIDEYPETVEYPHHPGLKVVKFARTDLDLLHTYTFSPLLDRFLKRIDRDLFEETLGMNNLDTPAFSISLVQWVVPVGALGLILLVVPLVRRRDGSAGPASAPLFIRNWSVWGAAALLVGFWSLRSLLGVLESPSLDKGYHSVWSFIYLCEYRLSASSAAAIVLVLRREQLARVFGIARKRLGRLALAIPAAIVAVVLLTAVFIIPLSWLGIVHLGPDANRYISNQTMLPFESWIGWVPLLILAALAEELLYRGVLHDALRRTVPTSAAAVLGSFVFAMAHLRPLRETVAMFATGLVLVALREKSRSLTPSLACHCLWNFLVAVAR